MFAADMMERWIKTDSQLIIAKIERISNIYYMSVIEEGDNYEEWLQGMIDEDAQLFKYPWGVYMSENPDLRAKRATIYRAISNYAKELVEAKRRDNQRVWDEYYAEQCYEEGRKKALEAENVNRDLAKLDLNEEQDKMATLR